MGTGKSSKPVSGLGKDIETLISTIQSHQLDAIRDGAMVYEAAVKMIAPVDTGTYRGSIRTADLDASTVGLGSSAAQMYRLEFGFSGQDVAGRLYNQSAQPHWRPAFDANKDAIRTAIATRLANAVRGATR